MEQKKEFIERRLRGEKASRLCAEYDISTRTGRRLWAKFKAQGVDGAIAEGSRRPHDHPGTFSKEVKEMVLAKKRLQPAYGARVLLSELSVEYPHIAFPKKTTAHRWFQQAGLTKSPKRRRGLASSYDSDLHQAEQSNDVMCIDHKGHFALGTKGRCYPLTVTDSHSRFVQGLYAAKSTAVEPTIELMLGVFDVFGLPKVIRSDNGVPFAAPAGGWGFTELSVLFWRLGIVHERIEKGKPQQNGTHERMHRELKRKTCRPAATCFEEQQKRFDHFQHQHNHVWPHRGLEQQTPASLYEPSKRPMPSSLPQPDYRFCDDVKHVQKDGHLRLFAHHTIYLSNALAHQPVGIVELDDGRWQIHFCQLTLGCYTPSGKSFERFPIKSPTKNRTHQ